MHSWVRCKMYQLFLIGSFVPMESKLVQLFPESVQTPHLSSLTHNDCLDTYSACTNALTFFSSILHLLTTHTSAPFTHRMAKERVDKWDSARIDDANVCDVQRIHDEHPVSSKSHDLITIISPNIIPFLHQLSCSESDWFHRGLLNNLGISIL